MKTLSLILAGLAFATTGIQLNAAPVEMQAQETVTIRTVDMRGKPPYKRSVQTLPVTDVAELEIVDTNIEPQYQGRRAPFKRY